MDVVAEEFVNSDLHDHSQCRHPLEKQRITTTFVGVADELRKFCHVLLVNL